MTEVIKNLKVAAYRPDASACAYFRQIAPLMIAQKNDLLGAAAIHTGVDLKALEENDIVLFGRETSPTFLKDMEYLQSKGVCCIVDTDDLLEAIPKHNPASTVYSPGSQRIKNYWKSLSMADGVTTTTWDLAQYVKEYNDNVHIVNNHIDFDLRPWTKHINTNDRIHIGWAGSSSHVEDIYKIGNVVKYILYTYPNVNYVHYGDQQIFDFLKERFNLNKDRMLHVKPMAIGKYVTELVNIDIGIAPITDVPFNRCKSALKPMEYGASMIPCVASDVAPYRRYIDHGRDGFLAKTEHEWIECISRLVEDTTLYKGMAEEAYNTAKQYDMSDNIHKYTNAWEQIYNNQQQYPEQTEWFANVIKVGRNEPCPCGSGTKTKKCCTKYL